jgi:DNA polymerase
MEKLDVLREQMINCGSCDLCHGRTNVVFGTGNETPQIMIIGEAPGEEEDLQGIPFVGRAGQKLDSILNYIGVNRQDVYITNAVLCRPPNNRNPRGEELSACKWRLDLQIRLLKPQLIIVLGRVAMQQLSGEPLKGALSQYFPENVKGEWLNYSFDGHICKVLVTYHPSYHLRSPERAYKITLPHWTQVKKWVEHAR